MSRSPGGTPHIIPVLDVLQGRVVHAVGGRRDQYQPVESSLDSSTDPIKVAGALLTYTGSPILYVADLDAITGDAPSHPWLEALLDAFPHITIWLDQGLRSPGDLRKIPVWKRVHWLPLLGWDKRTNLVPIFASESAEGPELAYALAREFAPRLVASLDLRHGRIRGNLEPWDRLGVPEDTAIPRMANAMLMASKAQTLIVLDVARVGEQQGVATGEWVQDIRTTWPDVFLVTGGGVRNWQDVDTLGTLGIDGVLVSTALHQGSLSFPRPVD